MEYKHKYTRLAYTYITYAVAIAAGPEVSITIDGSVYQFPDFKVFYNLDKLVEKMQ